MGVIFDEMINFEQHINRAVDKAEGRTMLG